MQLGSSIKLTGMPVCEYSESGGVVRERESSMYNDQALTRTNLNCFIDNARSVHNNLTELEEIAFTEIYIISISESYVPL